MAFSLLLCVALILCETLQLRAWRTFQRRCVLNQWTELHVDLVHLAFGYKAPLWSPPFPPLRFSSLIRSVDFSKRTSRTQRGTLICLLEHDASNATIFHHYSPQMSQNLETRLLPNLTNSAFKPPAASFTLSLHFAGLMQCASPVNECKVGFIFYYHHLLELYWSGEAFIENRQWLITFQGCIMCWRLYLLRRWWPECNENVALNEKEKHEWGQHLRFI